jgi:hypothetical protein
VKATAKAVENPNAAGEVFNLSSARILKVPAFVCQ